MDSKNINNNNIDSRQNSMSGSLSGSDTPVDAKTQQGTAVDFGDNATPVNTNSPILENNDGIIATFDLDAEEPATKAVTTPVGETTKADGNQVISETPPSKVLDIQGQAVTAVEGSTPETGNKPISIINQEIISVPLESHEQAVAVGELSTFETTDELSEEGANVLREQAKAKSLQFETLPNLHVGEGINLLLTKTESELAAESRKSSFNLFSAVAIMFLVIVSIVILGFNIITKVQLNNEKERLNVLEKELLSQAGILKANNDILNRFDLYQDVQESTFSPKEVLLYWQDLVTGFGDLKSIELTNGLKFKVDGQTDSLKEAAFLWHLLTIDDKVAKTNLNSLAKGEKSSRFNFEGDLDFEYFVNNRNLTDSSGE